MSPVLKNFRYLAGPLAVLLLVAFVFMKSRQPSGTEVSSDLASKPAVHTDVRLDSTHPADFQRPDTTNTLSQVEPETAATTVRHCLKTQEAFATLMGSSFGLENFLVLRSRYETVYDQLNFHFSENGQSFRLVLFPGQLEGPKENMQFFKVDSDGLPTRIATPENWRQQKPEVLAQTLEKEYRLEKKMEFSRTFLPNDGTLEIQTDNSRVLELSVTFKNADGRRQLLGCHLKTDALSCVCLAPTSEPR